MQIAQSSNLEKGYFIFLHTSPSFFERFLMILVFTIFHFHVKRFKLFCVAGDRFQSTLSSSFVALSFILEKENFSLAKSSSAVGFKIINFSTTLATLFMIVKLESSADFVE